MTKKARTYKGMMTVSSINTIGKTGLVPAKKEKMKLDLQITPYARINSKWIKDLSISLTVIKIIEKNRQ